MKKLLAMILALAMLLTLAACAGDPIDTSPSNDPGRSDADPTGTSEQTQPEKGTIYLVKSYETDMGYLAVFFDAYSIEFDYNEALEGGTVSMSANGETQSGTFTCDADHNITSIRIKEEGGTQELIFEMDYAESHRLLSAVITLADGAKSELLYSVEYTYNEQGKQTGLATVFPRFEIENTVINTYDEQGRLIEETTISKNGAGESYTKNIWEYNSEGILTGLRVCDGEGNVASTMEFTHETVDGMILCTADSEGFGMKVGFDQAGNIVLLEISSNGVVLSKNETTYDENGNLLSQTTFSGERQTRISYEYDEAAHLISTKQIVDGSEDGHTTTTYITVES